MDDNWSALAILPHDMLEIIRDYDWASMISAARTCKLWLDVISGINWRRLMPKHVMWSARTDYDAMSMFCMMHSMKNVPSDYSLYGSIELINGILLLDTGLRDEYRKGSFKEIFMGTVSVGDRGLIRKCNFLESRVVFPYTGVREYHHINNKLTILSDTKLVVLDLDCKSETVMELKPGLIHQSGEMNFLGFLEDKVVLMRLDDNISVLYFCEGSWVRITDELRFSPCTRFEERRDTYYIYRGDRRLNLSPVSLKRHTAAESGVFQGMLLNRYVDAEAMTFGYMETKLSEKAELIPEPGLTKSFTHRADLFVIYQEPIPPTPKFQACVHAAKSGSSYGWDINPSSHETDTDYFSDYLRRMDPKRLDR